MVCAIRPGPSGSTARMIAMNAAAVRHARRTASARGTTAAVHHDRPRLNGRPAGRIWSPKKSAVWDKGTAAAPMSVNVAARCYARTAGARWGRRGVALIETVTAAG